MKKFICFGFLCLLMSGCSAKLDEGYDKEALKEKAMEVVQYLNDEQYENVTAMGDDKMNTPTLTEKLKESWGTAHSEFGAFKEFDTFDFVGQEGNAVVIVTAVYDHNKVQFTVSFNADMQLCGLYFK